MKNVNLIFTVTTALSILSHSALAAIPEPVCKDATYNRVRLSIQRMDQTIETLENFETQGNMPAVCYRLAGIQSDLSSLVGEINTKVTSNPNLYFGNYDEFRSQVTGIHSYSSKLCGDPSHLSPPNEVELSQVVEKLKNAAVALTAADKIMCGRRR